MTDRPNGDAEGTRLRRRRPRRWTKIRRTRFLETLAESCNISAAARSAGMDRSSAYNLKDRDATFANGWKAALTQAHAAPEWHLLDVSNNGSVRTELVIDPETNKPKQIKLVHSYPLTVALRLFLSHQAEVEAYRIVGADGQGDDDAEARVMARIAEVRARLLRETARDDLTNAESEGVADDDGAND